MRKCNFTSHIVEREPEHFGDRFHRIAKRQRCFFYIVRVARITRRPAPTNDILVGIARPHTDVERLGDFHQIDFATEARRSGDKGIDPTGIDAAAKQTGATGHGGLFELSARLLTITTPGDEAGGGDDVDDGPQQPRHIIDIGVQRHIGDAVRLQRQQCLDIVGSPDPSLRPRLIRSPTSCPTLSLLKAYSPTSSRSWRSRMALTARILNWWGCTPSARTRLGRMWAT